MKRGFVSRRFQPLGRRKRPREDAVCVQAPLVLAGFWLVLLWAAADLLADPPRAVPVDIYYEPTPPAVVDLMLQMAGVDASDTVYDLGCGDGRIVVAAARDYGAAGVGVDIDRQRIRESWLNAESCGVRERVDFRQMDFRNVDLRPATVVTLYLLEPLNIALRPKLFRELRPGSRVVSHAFDMGDWEFDGIGRHDKARNGVVYLWVMPASAGGRWVWFGEGSNGARRYELELHQEYQAVHGWLSGDGFRTPIVDASLRGANLAFAAAVPTQRDGALVRFEGAVLGDRIRGRQVSDSNASEAVPWQARRVPCDISGAWRVDVLDDEFASRLEGVLTIRRLSGPSASAASPAVARGGLQASYTGEDGADVPVSAFFAWGSSLRLELTVRGRHCTLAGAFDAQSGSGVIRRSGSSATLRWRAARITAPAAANAASSRQAQ